MLGQNLEIEPVTLAFIRGLNNFDLTMLLSEVHDHGWEAAMKLIPTMKEAMGSYCLPPEPRY